MCFLKDRTLEILNLDGAFYHPRLRFYVLSGENLVTSKVNLYNSITYLLFWVKTSLRCKSYKQSTIEHFIHFVNSSLLVYCLWELCCCPCSKPRITTRKKVFWIIMERNETKYFVFIHSHLLVLYIYLYLHFSISLFLMNLILVIHWIPITVILRHCSFDIGKNCESNCMFIYLFILLCNIFIPTVHTINVYDFWKRNYFLDFGNVLYGSHHCESLVPRISENQECQN